MEIAGSREVTEQAITVDSLWTLAGEFEAQAPVSQRRPPTAIERGYGVV